MNKLLKSISISLTGIIVLMLLIGCTPGKAQTRGNDYKGSFQNEEFEAFDSNTGSDDEIPPMNKSKETYSSGKYAENSYEKNPRIKSEAGYGSQGNKDYKEVKGKYSESEYYSDETEETEPVQEKFYQKGMASWYGREFHGKTTASGERFDMNELTAAHKSLPFGTVVEVKNLENGKTVRLKINDRGPYRGNRIIDLSFAGAKELGIVKTGEASVGIRVIRMGDSGSAINENSDKRYVEPVADDESYTAPGDDNRSDYSDGVKLQAGAFYSRKNAENLKYKIEGMTDHTVRVVQDGDYYKVRVEGFRDRREMNKLKNMLSEDRISSFQVE